MNVRPPMSQSAATARKKTAVPAETRIRTIREDAPQGG